MSRILVAALLGTLALSAGAATKKAPVHKKAVAAAPAPVIAEATEEQKAAAGRTYVGSFSCEFNQQIQVSKDDKHDGYMDVHFGKQTWLMKPVLSSTGALRLEDVKGQTLMLQIAYKSMLMDVKAGHRIADECVSPEQAEAKKAAGA
jgi:hypothetical protein